MQHPHLLKQRSSYILKTNTKITQAQEKILQAVIIELTKDFAETGGDDELTFEVNHIGLKELQAYKPTMAGYEEGRYGGQASVGIGKNIYKNSE